MNRRGLIVDTDAKNEADDQYAIVHALLSPTLDVRGLVAAHWAAGHDTAAIITAARETGGIVTVEESIATGGLGGAVAETVVAELPVPMALLGFPSFCGTGSSAYLIDKAGMTPEAIAEAARGLISRKR